MDAGADGSPSRVPAKNQCSAFVVVNVDDAHVSMYPTSRSSCRSAGFIVASAVAEGWSTHEPEGYVSSQPFA